MVPFTSQRRPTSRNEMPKFINPNDPLYNDNTTGFSNQNITINAPKILNGSEPYTFTKQSHVHYQTKINKFLNLKTNLLLLKTY